MNKLITIGLTLIACHFSALASNTYLFPSAHENIEWCDVWIANADETNLPRVLLIGDSISRAYYPDVEAKLAGKAYVSRLSTSAFVSDPILLKEVQMILSQYKFDIIHFNNGMHGWQHSEAEYEEYLPKLVKVIRKCAPHAKLIWANTTPLKVSPDLPAENHTEATDARIDSRNIIAANFMRTHGVEIDDLNTPMRAHPEYHSDNIHFNEQGVAIQATQIAAKIQDCLR